MSSSHEAASGASNSLSADAAHGDFHFEEAEHAAAADAGHLSRTPPNEVTGTPLHAWRSGTRRDGSPQFMLRLENGVVLSYRGAVHSGSTTTLFGRWTGLGAYNDDLPVRSVGARTGTPRFSALDSYSMAFAIDMDEFGFYHTPSELLYRVRIARALQRGTISRELDPEEHHVARVLLHRFDTTGHLFGAHEDVGAGRRGGLHRSDPRQYGRDAVFYREHHPSPPALPGTVSPNLSLDSGGMEAVGGKMRALPAEDAAALTALLAQRRARGRVDREGAIRAHVVEDLELALSVARQVPGAAYARVYLAQALAQTRAHYDAAATVLAGVEAAAASAVRDSGGPGALSAAMNGVEEGEAEGRGADAALLSSAGGRALRDARDTSHHASFADAIREGIVHSLFNTA